MNLIKNLLSKHKIDPSGVIHVGAHDGQEYEAYQVFNKVLWIEPIPEYAERLRARGLDVVDKAIAEEEGIVDFYITTYDQGSSMLKPIDHTVDKKVSVEAVRLDSLNTNGYNCLVVDTQGSEHSVIKSAGEKIQQFDLVIAEGSDRLRYENSINTVDLITLMNSLGFKIVSYFEHKQDLIKDCVFVKWDGR